MVRSCVTALAALVWAASAAAFVMPGGRLPRAARSSGVGSWTALTGVAARPTPLAMSSVALPPPTSPRFEAVQEPWRSNVQRLRTSEDFVTAMAEHQDKLVVVKFYDQFCRACDEIRPRFEDLCRTYEDAVFYELEFSGSKELCKQLGIRMLPTVHIYAGADGRVADLPAGPSRFNQVEKRLSELVEAEASKQISVE